MRCNSNKTCPLKTCHLDVERSEDGETLRRRQSFQELVGNIVPADSIRISIRGEVPRGYDAPECHDFQDRIRAQVSLGKTAPPPSLELILLLTFGSARMRSPGDRMFSLVIRESILDRLRALNMHCQQPNTKEKL
jgi:hypothetical protein